jgi:membrane-bound metal-dependent hydrolase YbcI (DUF457 family)
MNFKQHATLGIITGVVCGVTASQITQIDKVETFVLCTIVAFTGSQFPDLDTKSTPSKWFARFAVLMWFFAVDWFDTWAVNLPLLVPGVFLNFMQSGKHRGWTHSYFVPMGCFGLGVYFKYDFMLFASFAIGVLSHYYLDRMSLFKKSSWV